MASGCSTPRFQVSTTHSGLRAHASNDVDPALDFAPGERPDGRAAAAFAADQPGHGASEAVFFIQLVVLMLVGRLLGEVLLRLRQPAVMGQLMAGLVLGPSILGALFPEVQHALFPAAKEQKAMLEAFRSSACC